MVKDIEILIDALKWMASQKTNREVEKENAELSHFTMGVDTMVEMFREKAEDALARYNGGLK